ncbi:MAG: DUF4395 domain-containing protein [Thermoleophilia bacterium]|jgi:Domain of unknown function (DUF4395)
MSIPYRTVDPYRDTHVIDSRGPRTNQAIVGVGALIAFLLHQEWIIVLLALQLIVGLTLGRRFCLPCRLWFDVLQPRLGEGTIEDARVPRFANIIGAVFLTVSSILLYAGSSNLGWALALIVAALALLAATTGVCVGCEMYMLIARARGIVVDRHPAV